MWFDLDDNGNPVQLPDGVFPNNKPASQFHLKTKVKEYEISTVFLGLDHSHGHGPPVLFETMVFGGDKYDCVQERYYTKKEAIKGHKKIVKEVEELSGLLKKL